MTPLTIIYVTARPEPEIAWFIESLQPQVNSWEHIEVIIVDGYPDSKLEAIHFDHSKIKSVIRIPPKPNIWGGVHRITKEEWWHVSASRNTGICLCKTPWLAFLDDRCVLMPTWLQAIRNAMEGMYAVCGSYEKHHNMIVENGMIRNGGIVTGRDNRDTGREPYARTVDGGYWYGCTNALPLEWALNVGGYAEDKCDGLSFEDIPFGMTLKNNAYPIKFDPTMKMVEDRTPERLGPAMKRSDYGVSPNDKSHAVLNHFRTARHSGNSFDIWAVRDAVLRGEPFPAPSASHNEWFTGRPIVEL